MTSQQFEAFLAQAGVDAGAVGAPERLLLPEPQVDEARTGRAGLAFAPPPLLDVRSDALAAAGIEAGFDEDARTLVLSARPDLAFGLAAAGSPGVFADAGGTRIHVATDRPSAFGLWSVAGPLAIGSIDARAIELRVVYAWPAPPAVGSGVDVLNGAGVAVETGAASRWDATVFAGRLARNIVSGVSESATVAARRWPRQLTADQRTLIERFALVRARDVAARLDRLQTQVDPADASLDLAWQALCWTRDDVDGIRVLLREAGAGEALTTALRSVDEGGRAMRFSWPSEIDVHDDRLQRVSEADPGAWWGSTRRQVVWL